MSTSKPDRRQRRPATTPEGRENQLISLAYDAAERLFIEGSVPAQVITHFLKAGSERDRLERARLENENLLLSAKVEQIQSAQRMEDLYKDAMRAFSEYSGQDETYDTEG
jgi:hypothetical protein